MKNRGMPLLSLTQPLLNGLLTALPFSPDCSEHEATAFSADGAVKWKAPKESLWDRKTLKS
ncbi:hypothetical protein [Pedobacter fastidiosus]|nr:hypothetical protein [Pedobacter fastidiosus]